MLRAQGLIGPIEMRALSKWRCRQVLSWGYRSQQVALVVVAVVAVVLVIGREAS